MSYQFACSIPAPGSTWRPSSLGRILYAAPTADQDLQSEPRVECQNSAISAQARTLVCDLQNPADQFDAFYRFVADDIANEPTSRGPGESAVDCLRNAGGDAAAKSRLLVALCRNRGIPARMITGLTLRRGHEQAPHVWVEAWLNSQWVPACTVYRRLGRLPTSQIAFVYGDLPLVRGRHTEGLECVFLVEKAAPEPAAIPPSGLKLWLMRVSLNALPPAERHLVGFLVLLPIAALIVCIFRNLIGLNSFGTFAPALIGLAFRDLASSPGIVVFVSIILLGWLLRKVLDHYHLLQVPRMAFLLSLVVLALIVFIVAASLQGWAPTKYISLFPMIILTGMIERFWTLETEDSTLVLSSHAAGHAVYRGHHQHRHQLSGCRAPASQLSRDAGLRDGSPALDGPLHGLSPPGAFPLPRFDRRKGSACRNLLESKETSRKHGVAK